MASEIKVDTSTLSDEVVVTAFASGGGLPLFIQPNTTRLYDDTEYAIAWLDDHRPALLTTLLSAGAVVLRGFPIHTSAEFSRIIAGYPNFEAGYFGGASQRGELAPKVLEATRAPADVTISIHQEMSYMPNFPKKIAFFCRMPAVTGGHTLICDMREATSKIDPVFYGEVEKRGVRYERHYRSPEDTGGDPVLNQGHKTWCEAFNEDPAAAEAGVRALGLEPHWEKDGSLTVTYNAPGIISHPGTGERLWFNQVPTQAMTRSLLGSRFDIFMNYYRDRRQPFHNTYGDGTEIPIEYLEAANTLLNDLAVTFHWSHGDIMLLDNYIVGHGRSPLTGKRDVQVALLG